MWAPAVSNMGYNILRTGSILKRIGLSKKFLLFALSVTIFGPKSNHARRKPALVLFRVQEDFDQNSPVGLVICSQVYSNAVSAVAATV